MRHIISPNRWSCLPSSFASVCDVSLKDMLDLIGHDGSEILWPKLEEPYKRRSFHIQECVVAAYKLGFKFTLFETICTAGVDKYNTYSFTDYDFINQILPECCGVLLGQGVNTRHAVAWDSEKVLDPSGRTYTLPSNLFTLDKILVI